jgi:hypothetical protein
MDEEKLIMSILVQRHECLYNLQHKDYDNNLVKNNCWKETAGELLAQGKKMSHNILFATEQLADAMGLCDTTQIM